MQSLGLLGVSLFCAEQAVGKEGTARSRWRCSCDGQRTCVSRQWAETRQTAQHKVQMDGRRYNGSSQRQPAEVTQPNSTELGVCCILKRCGSSAQPEVGHTAQTSHCEADPVHCHKTLWQNVLHPLLGHLQAAVVTEDCFQGFRVLASLSMDSVQARVFSATRLQPS